MDDIRIGGYTLPRKRAIAFAAAFLLWTAGIVLGRFIPSAGRAGPVPLRFAPLVLFLASWFFAGLPALRNAAGNLLRGRALDENFLMSIATIGAFAVGEWEEAAGVMIFYMIGELVQEAAVARSRASIDALLALKPDKARIMQGGDWVEVPAGDVKPGSLVLVRPGERIPLDGTVVEGESSLDLSMLTGESRPVPCGPGGEVKSGTVSLNGVLRIRAERSAGDSSAARIVKLVESAREAKAKPERFISAFARWYTPFVAGAAALLAVLPPLVIPDARFSDWLYRALILLVISCPCALVVSIPLGYFAGIGGLSRRGIMVKGAVHLDSLNKAKTVIFDKTGTLTRGKFSVAALEPAPGTSEKELLESAALAERESNHPIAKAILEYAEGRGWGGNAGKSPAGGAETETRLSGGAETAGCNPGGKGSPARFEIAGQGLEVFAEGTRILAGNRRLLESRELRVASAPEENGEGACAPVYIARDGKYAGRILVGDVLKEGAVEAVSRLRAMGIETRMFTGDTRASARETAARLGIDLVEAELLPEDKLAKLEAAVSSGTTIFVGDGINDAPALARAHVGIAMGSGADAAVEAADAIAMTDDPRRIPEAIIRAKKTRRIVAENTVFALAAKAAFIALAALGMANMWIALIADVGVALAAIVNSARALGADPKTAGQGPGNGRAFASSPKRRFFSEKSPKTSSNLAKV